MALAKLIGRGVGAATRRGAADKGKNRLMADYADDVVKETKSDIAQIRRAMRLSGSDEEPTTRGVARQSAIEAGGRAMMRTGTRAGAVGLAGAAGLEQGRIIEEEANKTRRRLAEEAEDKTPKRVAVASRSMDEDEEETPKREAKKEMSFKEAFAAARKEDKATFMWQGKRYTTEMAKEGPKASVREGKNENIDEDTRKRAEMYKGGSVTKMAKGGSIPTIYAGVKPPRKPSASSVKGLPRNASVKAKMPTKLAKGGAVKGKKK